MADLSTFTSLSPYISLGGVVLAIITWGRDLTRKIETIKSNHLAHVEQYTEETRTQVAELVSGQGRAEKLGEQQVALLVEQGKVLTEIATILRERG